jgi:hypothetical protein
MITEPGVYEGISAVDYHADPCPEPSLSASLIDRLLERSPAHARAAHPRFVTPETEDWKFNLGEAVHTMLLGGQPLCVIDERSYQGKEARLARDAALNDHQLPILTHQLNRAETICDAIRTQIKLHPELNHVLDPPGLHEATVLWREDLLGSTGLWCRCRPDILFDREIWDLKITATAATPEVWGAGHAWRMGYPRRAAWYRRGLRKVMGVMPSYRFIVVENEAPYALSHFECSNEALDLGVKEVEAALEIWTRCMQSGDWPAYSTELQWINPPVWAQYRSAEVLARHQFSTHDEVQSPHVIEPWGFGV